MTFVRGQSLTHSPIGATTSSHANLMQTSLVQTDIHLLAIGQRHTNGAIVVEAEDLAHLTILNLRPRVVLLVVDELQHLAFRVGNLISILQSLHGIVATVLSHHLLGLAHIAGNGVVTRPELDCVEQKGVGERADAIDGQQHNTDDGVEELAASGVAVPICELVEQTVGTDARTCHHSASHQQGGDFQILDFHIQYALKLVNDCF